MNAYQEKQEARKQRYLDRAEKKASESTAAYNSARKIMDMIPFGQPILVGHHSEGRARADHRRIERSMDKSCELANTAKYYEQKAASVGKGGISSDDPEAVRLLKEKLAKCEKLQETMVAANKLIRKNDRAGLAALGFSETRINQLFTPDFCGRLGFPSYSTQNNNAEIRRLKIRIEELSKAAEVAEVKKEFNGFDYCEEDNRAQFIFPGKPSEEIRAILKYHAFKWSPSRGAWVRQLTGNGRYAAECVIKKLQEA